MSPLSSKPESQSGEMMDILYRITHDFQAPIRGMTEMARILAEDHNAQLDDQAREYLDLLVECGGTIQKMMHGLTDYVRIGRETAISAAVDCNLLFDRCHAKFKMQAEVNRQPLPVIFGNAAQMEVLFTHLMDNALKFHDAKTKPEILLSAERVDNGYWQFCLRDNGIGITEENRGRIFDLFQRLHADDVYPGIGMGLAMARQIIYNHGGQIWCTPNAPQGTCFYFTLPPMEKI